GMPTLTSTRRPLTRVATTLTSLFIAAATVIISSASASPADAATSSRGPAPRLSSYDARLLHDINAARVSYGRAPLVATAGTTDVAHRWSCYMGRRSTLGHRPDLVAAISRHGSSDWHTMGENVGDSGSSD